MDTRQYDPLQVVGSFGIAGKAAVDILDGRIDGEFFSGVRDNPLFTREHDAHGNSTRVRNNNRGGTVTITLSASSPTNRILSAMHEADELGENVVGVLVIRDLNGDTVLEASRYGITTVACGPQFRPLENYTRGLRPEAMARCPPDILRRYERSLHNLPRAIAIVETA